MDERTSEGRGGLFLAKLCCRGYHFNVCQIRTPEQGFRASNAFSSGCPGRAKKGPSSPGKLLNQAGMAGVRPAEKAMTDVHQLEQNRQVYSVEGAEAVIISPLFNGF